MKVRSCFVSNSSSSSFIVCREPDDSFGIEYEANTITNDDIDFYELKEIKLDGDYYIDLNEYAYDYENKEDAFQYLDFYPGYIPESIDNIEGDLDIFLNTNYILTDVYNYSKGPEKIDTVKKMAYLYLKYLKRECKEIYDSKIVAPNDRYGEFLDKLNKIEERDNIYLKITNLYDDTLSIEDRNKDTEERYFNEMYIDKDTIKIFKVIHNFLLHEFYSFYNKKIFTELSIPYGGDMETEQDILLNTMITEDISVLENEYEIVNHPY